MEKQKNLCFDDLDNIELPLVLKQYREIKKEYLDFIVFFQMGSFYEVYFKDAEIVSEICGIQLTKRHYKTGSMPMAGVSNKSLDDTVRKIIKENYKVVVALQFEDDKNNGILTRKAAKIYTRGTVLKEEFLNAKKNNYLAAIYKDNENYELCYSDISIGQIYTSSGKKADIINELSRIQPVEIIIQKGQKFDFLENGIKTEEIEDTNFEIKDNYNHAHSAILNYTNQILKEDMIEFEDLKKYSIQNILSIDYRTRKNLELLENAYNNSYKGSLLWALNNCKTPMGARLLASFISTPLTDKNEIKKRQNALKKYLSNKEVAEKINSLLDETSDIARLASGLSNETITPLGFFYIKEGLKNALELSKITDGKEFNLTGHFCNFELISSFYEILNNTISDDINEVIKGKFLKQGVDSNLDMLLLEEASVKKRAEEYEKELINKTGILKLKIIRKQGAYSVEIPASSIVELPPEFKIIQKLANIKRYTTDKLVEIENEILILENKIQETKNTIFNNLKKYAQSMTPIIRNYAKFIGDLDILNSFYKLSEKGVFCFSEINEEKFELKEIRHLIAEKLGRFDPLDISFEDKNLIVLTGINGSGKSTLIKTIALIVILSQTGFLIPAKSAAMPIFYNLFSILSMSDELINKKSHHQAQMKNLSEICQNIDKKSIVLLDELGKNTSYKEGVSLACGVIKYFLEKNNAKTILSTHFASIKDLIQPLNSKILYEKIDFKNDKRVMERGIINKSEGIKSAENENIPPEITEFASEILKTVKY